MRYADISSPTELNVPPMPTLPGELGPSRRAGQTGRDMDEVVKDSSSARAEAKAKADDKKLLDQESFDPDACMLLDVLIKAQLTVVRLEDQVGQLDRGRTQVFAIISSAFQG